MESFFRDLFQLQENAKKEFGEKHGEILFEYILNIIQFTLKTKLILHELDLLKEIYSNSIFKLTEKFFQSREKKDFSKNELFILNTAKEIIGNHSNCDEINLLFYVGLYHKIENYENEILKIYNALNNENHKTLKSIGVDIPNKKKLFSDRDRVRIICNSIKHNNFYPKKELLKFYPYLSIKKKITLSDLNPVEDIELIKHYINYFNLLISLKSLMTQLGDYNTSSIENHFKLLLEDEDYKEDIYKFTYLNTPLH